MTHGFRALVVASICGLLIAQGAVAQENAVAKVVHPRSFGYVLGDVMTERVLLRANGHAFDPAALPPLERTGAWLQRRAASIETEGGERWLVLEYQVINAPQSLTAIALPALTLASREAGGATLTVAAWPVSVGPLTPAKPFAQGALQSIQPDRQPEPLALAPLRRSLGVSMAALAFVVVVWLGWWAWRNRRDAQRMPFARACHALERFDPARVDNENDAWLHVHRALNDTAGQALHATTLGALFARAPYLQPLQARLEGFYARSAERFFALAPGREPYGLLELCRALRRLERRHRR